jgi:hypothetical protein
LNKLSDQVLRRAKAAPKPRKLLDGGGLYVIVRPNGSRWWRLDYTRPGSGKRPSARPELWADVPLCPVATGRAERDPSVRRTHAEFLPERRKMMQARGDYLDKLRTGAEVVPIRRAANE